jgi:hypothetical protein
MRVLRKTQGILTVQMYPRAVAYNKHLENDTNPFGSIRIGLILQKGNLHILERHLIYSTCKSQILNVPPAMHLLRNVANRELAAFTSRIGHLRN